MGQFKRKARALYHDLIGKSSRQHRQQRRPLFVTEATLKHGGLWSGRSVLLVVTCAEVVVLEVKKDSPNSEADVLLLIPAEQLLPPSAVTPCLLRLNYHSSSIKVQPSLFCLTQPTILSVQAPPLPSPPSPAAAAAAGEGTSCKDTDSISSSHPTGTLSTSSSMTGLAETTSTSSAISSTEQLLLAFADEATATSAAAAIVYASAAHKAAASWLYLGLPPALTMGVAAVGLSYTPVWASTSGSGGGVNSGSGASSKAAPFPRPQPPSAAAGAGSGREEVAVAGPCGWGVALQLPASWQAAVAAQPSGGAAAQHTAAAQQTSPAAAAAAAAGQGGKLAQAAADEAAAAAAARYPYARLSTVLGQHGVNPASLPPGAPQCLRVTLSTPLGVAVASIRLAHLKAALAVPGYDLVLAVPASVTSDVEGSGQDSVCSSDGGSDSSLSRTSPVPILSFGLQTSGRLPRASSSGELLQSLVSPGRVSNSGTQLGAPVTTVCYQQSVYAAVRLSVRKGREVLGNRQVVLLPPGSHAVVEAPRTTSLKGQQQQAVTAAVHATSSSGSSSSMEWLQQARPWLLAALLLVLVVLLVRQPLATLKVLLPAAAASALLRPASSHHHLQQQQAGGSSAGAAFSSSSTAACRPAKSGNNTTTFNSSKAGGTSLETVMQEQEQEQQQEVGEEDWVVILEGAVLQQEPGAYLQAQINHAKAEAEAAEAAAAVEARGAAAAAAGGGGGPPGAAAGGRVVVEAAAAGSSSSSGGAAAVVEKRPWLVSDPEPAWVTPDVYDRFLIGKGTLAAARKQAAVTHAWRQRLGVDACHSRPCRSFHFMRSHLADYLLAADSRRGIVEVAFVSQLKGLADQLRAHPSFGPGDLEEYLAWYNEYLYKVAVRDPLPGGCQTLIVDCSGAQLSYIMGDTIRLFRILASMGLYYPERLAKAIVINAPSWFAYAWKIAAPILDEATRSKVVVVSDPQQAYAELEAALGADAVPAAYGGPCTTPLGEYAAGLAVEAYYEQQQAKVQQVDVQQEQ